MRLEVRIEVRRAQRPLEYAFETDAAVTGVFGPSGAGKTSLLNAIAGLLTPTSGVIRLAGAPVFDRDRKVDVPAHRRRIGVAFQDDRLFPHLRVAGNLRYGHAKDFKQMAEADQRGVSFDDVVDLLDLRALLGRRVRNLSGGERRRVTIGRALLASPRLLLLDEPLSSLDLGHRRPILDLIRRLREATGVPILYVSHDITEILQLTNRLLVIENGRSVAHGSLREIARDAHAWRTVRDLGPLNVFPVAIAAHDTEAGLTALTLQPDRADRAEAGATRLLAPLVDASVGTRGWASVRSEDVALARARVDGVSIRNQIRGTITEITSHPDRAIVEVDAGTSLLVEVSHQTVRQMELATGAEVWCLVKSNAVELSLDA